MTPQRSAWICRLIVVLSGIISIAIGIYLFINWIEMFTIMRGKEMALSPNSPAFAGWKISPLPLNFDVYLFNWTNPEDFYIGSKVKPRFVELGPYRFRESPDKVNLQWHNQNSSLSFRKKAAFYFDAKGSKGSLNDKITTVNTVTHAAALRAKDANFFVKNVLQNAFNVYGDEIIAITKTADEWMFTGYSDPLVTMSSLLKLFSRDIVVPYDRVGWLYTRNNSAEFEGHFNIYTGSDDVRKMGQIHTWNQATHTGGFDGECGDVKGSMGEFFQPNLTPNDSISIFLPNLCRSVPLDYTETEIIQGVTAYKFSGGKRAVDNGTLYPETKCFCIKDKCEAAGVINISRCKYNTSIYMSYPHFYKADPSYLEAVEGLSPVKEKHEFYMTLEPNAGVPMDVGGGFQANYLLEPIPGINSFHNIPRTFIPIMWCEERVQVTPEIAKDIALVPFIILLGQILTGALLASGLILICWYPTKIVTRLCYDDDPKVKKSFLNTLCINGKTQPVTVTLTQIRLKPEGLSLLEYGNNDSTLNSNGTVTENLLINTRKLPTDIINSR